MARIMLLISIVLANTWLSLSDSIGGWFAREEPSEARLPPWLISTIANRPSWGDAEIHALMWGAAALVATATVTRPRLWVVLGALWVWSLTLEVLQGIVTDTRAAQWGDAVGNSVGIIIAAFLGVRWQITRQQKT